MNIEEKIELIQPKTTSTSVEQYQCQSYYDDEGTLQDCTCGKCGKQTTSTDIEEVRKEFELLFTIDGLFEDDLRGHRLLHTNNSKRIWNFFAPHLSNKSELKKEAVKDVLWRFAEHWNSVHDDEMQITAYEVEQFLVLLSYEGEVSE